MTIQEIIAAMHRIEAARIEGIPDDAMDGLTIQLGELRHTLIEARATCREDVAAKADVLAAYSADEDRFEIDAMADLAASIAADWQALAEARIAA